MTTPTNPARLVTILDAATVTAGIVTASVGVGFYDWRAGVMAFGALLLAAEVVAALLRRR
jgi:hypothetical protein